MEYSNGRYKLKKVKEVGLRTIFEQVNQYEEYYDYRYILAYDVKYTGVYTCKWASGIYDLTYNEAIEILKNKML
jgi:hypothetical protein